MFVANEKYREVGGKTYRENTVLQTSLAGSIIHFNETKCRLWMVLDWLEKGSLLSTIMNGRLI